jgi:hypothetical protein
MLRDGRVRRQTGRELLGRHAGGAFSRRRGEGNWAYRWGMAAIPRGAGGPRTPEANSNSAATASRTACHPEATLSCPTRTAPPFNRAVQTTTVISRLLPDTRNSWSSKWSAPAVVIHAGEGVALILHIAPITVAPVSSAPQKTSTGADCAEARGRQYEKLLLKLVQHFQSKANQGVERHAKYVVQPLNNEQRRTRHSFRRAC